LAADSNSSGHVGMGNYPSARISRRSDTLSRNWASPGAGSGTQAGNFHYCGRCTKMAKTLADAKPPATVSFADLGPGLSKNMHRPSDGNFLI